jgi:hypothetical protein
MGMNQNSQNQVLSQENEKSTRENATREDVLRFLSALSETPSYN